MKKMIRAGVGIAVGLCAIAGAACYFQNPLHRLQIQLQMEQDEAAMQIYNSEIVGTEFQSEGDRQIREYWDRLEEDAEQEEKEYSQTANRLQKWGQIENDGLAKMALGQAVTIKVEGDGRKHLRAAQAHVNAEEYVEAMLAVKKIDESYTEYQRALDLYKLSTQNILAQTQQLELAEDYDQSIQLLADAYQRTEDTSFLERQKILESEVQILRDEIHITKSAAVSYEQEAYKEAFSTLKEGMKKYPESEKIEDYWNTYHTSYIAQVTQQANEACEKKDYKGAMKIVKAASKAHDCAEFDTLMKQIRKEKSFLYWAVNDMFS